LVFQNVSNFRTSLELVKLKKKTLEEIQKIELHIYKLQFPLSLLEKFDSINQAYHYAEKLFKAKHSFSSLSYHEGKPCIVSPISTSDRSLQFITSSEQIGIERVTEPFFLDLSDNAHANLFSDLLYQNLRKSFINAGYSVKRTTAVDTRTNLIDWISNPTTNRIFQKLRPYISLFPAFNFGSRIFDHDFFVQISPRSVIDYSKDIYSLLADASFTTDSMQEMVENVSLPVGRTAKLYGILDKQAAQSIDEKPFDGLSFIDFAKKTYPYLFFNHGDAKLLLVLPFGNRSSPYYFSSELVKPTVRFSDLANWDHDFYSKLGSEMKNHSARRLEHIQNCLRDIKFDFFGVNLELSELYYFEGKHETLEPSDFSKKSDMHIFEFPSPWVCFKNRETGRVVDVKRHSTPYWGATVDLLNHDELACFESPPDVKIKVIADESLFEDTCNLMNVLRDGFGQYRGFEAIFGTKLSFEVSFGNLLSKEIYDDISPANYDCALIFGPRHLPEGPGRSKEIYIFPETEILKKGVPVQFITNDPSINKTYDKSIRTKSNDPNALFGISLNILGKIGAKVMKLSPMTTNHFLPNSIVLGYNICRVFLPLAKDISQEKSPKELVWTSTPLAAPLVMMNQDGAEIVTQAVYPVPDETALFKEDRAERIINELPEQYHYVIIHKDGRFYPEEIADLKKLQQEQRKIIPVSIISYHAPRIFSFVASLNHVPKSGTVVKLSETEFLMVNSLVQDRYNAKSRGWPNTVLVTIHEEALQRNLTFFERRQILYQIWALTRVHVGSQLPTRKPISIHYSDSMASFIRKSGDPFPEYFSKFGTARNRYGYIPRIFL